MAAIFDNKWRSSDPGGSEAMTIRMVITYTVITIRLYCRIAKSPNKPLRERLGWDDVFILLALFTSTIGQAVVFWGFSRGGGGTDMIVLIRAGRYDGVSDFLLSNFIGALTDYFTLTLIRLSILTFYCKIFGVDAHFRKVAIILGSISIAWTLACMFGQIFMCTPISHLWKPLSPGHCRNFVLFYAIVSSIETGIDAAILLLPVRPVLNLHLPLQTRLAILGIFVLGSFVIISNILRTYFMYQPNTNYLDFKKACLWISVHITSAFACACLPLCKAFALKFVDLGNTVSNYANSLLGSSRRSFTGREGSSGSKRGGAGTSNSSVSHEANASDPSLRKDIDKPTFTTTIKSTHDQTTDKNARMSKGVRVDNEFEMV